MNHNTSGRPRRNPSRGRRAVAWRLPVGRVRDLLELLSRRGPVFAPAREPRGIRLRRVASTLALSRKALRPTIASASPVLPPADAFMGYREDTFSAAPAPESAVLFGVPPCLVRDIRFLDSILASGPFRDAGYARHRRNLIVVAMNCDAPGPGCRCLELGTGPRVRARREADLVLTSAGSGFLMEAGSAAGVALAAGMGLVAARKARHGVRAAPGRKL